MSAFADIELAQRTPFLLSYVVIKHDQAVTGDKFIEIAPERLIDDAAKWRDRPIYKLVTAKISTHSDARRLFQGIGLVDASHLTVLRGRLTITPDTNDPWGVCPAYRHPFAAVLINLPSVRHESMAVVTLEVERNR